MILLIIKISYIIDHTFFYIPHLEKITNFYSIPNGIFIILQNVLFLNIKIIIGDFYE